MSSFSLENLINIIEHDNYKDVFNIFTWSFTKEGSKYWSCVFKNTIVLTDDVKIKVIRNYMNIYKSDLLKHKKEYNYVKKSLFAIAAKVE